MDQMGGTAAVEQPGDEGAGHQDVRPVVHIEDPPHLLQRHRPQRLSDRAEDPGVVAHHIDMAEPVERHVREPFDRIGVGQVGRHRRDLPAVCGEFGGPAVHPVALDVRHDHADAGPREAGAQGEADAAGRTRHHCCSWS